MYSKFIFKKKCGSLILDSNLRCLSGDRIRDINSPCDIRSILQFYWGGDRKRIIAEEEYVYSSDFDNSFTNIK